MNATNIFLPSVFMAALTYIVLVYMFRGRLAGIKKHQARIQTLADPVKEAQIFTDSANSADNFENLFEMPVLLYVASVIIYVLSKVDALYLGLTWLYVILRYAHSYIHCTNNRVKYRFRIFAGSVIVLFIIWMRLAAQIIL